MTNARIPSHINSWDVKKRISTRLNKVFARPSLPVEVEAQLWRELSHILTCGPMPTWAPDRPYGDVCEKLKDLLDRLMLNWSDADPRFPSSYVNYGKTTDQREAKELLRWADDICKAIDEVENEVFPPDSEIGTVQDGETTPRQKLRFPGSSRATEMQAKHGLTRGVTGQ